MSSATDSPCMPTRRTWLRVWAWLWQRTRRLGSKVGNVVMFPRRVTARLSQLGAACHELAEQSRLLEQRLGQITEQIDLLKSRTEVGPELFAAFQQWRASTPLPPVPLVSVCVTTYNRSRLLCARCLPSILGQSYTNLEVIVVGDGCTDDTAAAVTALNDPRVRFENLPQRGEYPKDPARCWMVAGSVPMNRALSLCRGDYVTHLDDDDEFLPERIERLISFALSKRCDFVWHPFWSEGGAGQWHLNACPELRLGCVTTSVIFYRSWLRNVTADVHAHLLMEPGDWNRIRRMKYLGALCLRYPEPLTRHYRERQNAAA